jgi:hypothetical protein
MEKITAAFGDIDYMEKRASQKYKGLIDRFPKSIKLLRSYGRFLEQIMVFKRLF